jgi:hypothetical protein
VRAAAFVAIAVVGSLACGGLLGLEDPKTFDGGDDDGSPTGEGGPGSEGGPSGDGGGDALDSPQGAGDGPAVDAESDGAIDGADPCVPVPGNLLANNNADFEQGCAGWFLNGGTMNPSAQAHCGSMACQLCPPPATYDTVFTGFNIPVFQGEQYELRAFVRAVGDPFFVWGAIAFNAGQAQAFGSQTTLSGEYTSLSPALVTITTQTNIVNLEVGMGRGDGGCLLLDDMVLLRVRDASAD